MITRNVDYFRPSTTEQLIVSRFINDKGEVERGQAHVSFGGIDDSFYDKIHETGSIKKQRGPSKGDDSFLGEEYFKNKVPFSFKEGKCLVLTCLVSFQTYSDESLKPIKEQEGISDCFFQEKSFKEIKNLDIDHSRYSTELKPPRVEPPASEEEAKNECKRLEYELDIPIFGVKGSQDIQFINGPISIGPLKFQIEPKIEKEEGEDCEEDEEESEPDPDPNTENPDPTLDRRVSAETRRLRWRQGDDPSTPIVERAALFLDDVRVFRDPPRFIVPFSREDEARLKAEAEARAKARAKAEEEARKKAEEEKEEEEEEEEEEKERGKCDPPEDYEPPEDKFYGHFPIKFL
jgi:hypothetical protein